MRNLQDIFNVVIESGLYREEMYMCHALSRALYRDLISLDEYIKASTSIDIYLKFRSSLSMKRVFEQCGRKTTMQDRLAIYKDWRNRPRLVDRG